MIPNPRTPQSAGRLVSPCTSPGGIDTASGGRRRRVTGLPDAVFSTNRTGKSTCDGLLSDRSVTRRGRPSSRLAAGPQLPSVTNTTDRHREQRRALSARSPAGVCSRARCNPQRRRREHLSRLFAGIGVLNVGHANPSVTEAAVEQARRPSFSGSEPWSTAVQIAGNSSSTESNSRFLPNVLSCCQHAATGFISGESTGRCVTVI